MKREEKIDKDIDMMEDQSTKILVRYLHKIVVVVVIAYSAAISKMLYDKNQRIEKMEIKMEVMERAKDSVNTLRFQEQKNSYFREDSVKQILKNAGL